MRKKVHQVKEELLQELSKENGKEDTDELMDFAARLQQGTRSLETSQLESRAAVEAKNAEAATSGLAKLHDDKTPFLNMTRRDLYAYPTNVVINVAYLVTPFRRGGPVGRMLQWMVTRRWLDHKMAPGSVSGCWRRISGSGR